MDREVKIWDPVVRIGHWMVVVAFAVAYLVEDELLTVHVWAGYIAGAAVALRILWGFVGPERARFSNFVYGPRTIVTYLSDLARFRARRYLGHSPAGGAMAVALLAMLAGTVITGLMAYGADKKAGPLAPLYAAGEPLGPEGQRARSDQGGSTKQDGEESTIGELHDFLANLTLILVLVHVTGVALASIAHRENLVAAMITGRKRAENHRPETGRGPVIGQ